MGGGRVMAEYIECRNCDSHDCKGCNLKNLETMLKNGKFDCLMNENRCINTAADVAPVRHGRWIEPSRLYYGAKQYECSLCYSDTFWKKHSITEKYPYCPNCGCRMDGGDDE